MKESQWKVLCSHGNKTCVSVSVHWPSPVVVPSLVTPPVILMTTWCCTWVSALFAITARFISCLDRFEAKVTIWDFSPLPATFLKVSDLPNRAEQPAIKHVRWAESRKPLTCKQLSIKRFQPRLDRLTLTHQISCLDQRRSNQSPLCIISMIREHTGLHTRIHTHHHQLSCVFIRPNELYDAYWRSKSIITGKNVCSVCWCQTKARHAEKTKKSNSNALMAGKLAFF